MEIIEIKKYNEIEGLVYGFCAEPNVENALVHFKDKFGIEPEKCWVKKQPSGRSTIYMKIPIFETDKILEDKNE